MMQIPDPVHGYITLEGMYADIVNTPEFQRLRYIEQVSFRPSYPGARHDRFIHSLGTYHLAGKFAGSFFENLVSDVTGVKISAAEKRRLISTFRYAALLHDIGHAPFSHTTEDFFLEQKASTGLPLVWDKLCGAVEAVNAAEGALFRREKAKIGAAHEIVSALLLVSKWDALTNPKKKREDVDLALAARMVIGFPYKPGDPDVLGGGCGADSLGIRNCLIQMLNYSTLDVDRLDYMVRDSKLTGYPNAPLDLDCLAASVTAVRKEDGWLAPAYRDSALRVFDLMFQAKVSHDAWVIGSTASLYEAELLKHCIRGLNQKIHKDYMSTVFSPEALGFDGVRLGDPGSEKHYRLLSDVDISADLKAQSGEPYDELYSRKLSVRRIAAWRSYYEYHHIFNAPELDVTPDAVCEYFRPLLKHMAKTEGRDNSILVFNSKSYQEISRLSDPRITHPAQTLYKYLISLPREDDDSVVLLEQTSRFTMKLDPADIRIVFSKRNIPVRSDGRNYSTYSELTGVTADDRRSNGFFYLYRHGGLGSTQLANLRRKLAPALKDARKKGILTDKKEEPTMTVISTPNAPAAIGPYSQGMVQGNLVFCSGQIPVDPATGLIPEGITAQAEQSCKNVAAVLAAAGSDVTKVIKTTCFIADMGDFAAFNEVYAKYFTGKPARSCCAVKTLPKNVLCEIEAIAEL